MLTEDAAQLQDDELVALESIYPAEQVRIRRSGPADSQRGHVVSFSLPVVLPVPIKATVRSSQPTGPPPQQVTLSFLPPLYATARLPKRYPLSEPPHIENLSAPWLSDDRQRAWVRERLEEQWQELQGEVLWTWAEWLKTGWAEEHTSPFVGSDKGTMTFQDVRDPAAAAAAAAATQKASAGRDLLQTLLAFDKVASKSVFDKDRYICSICMEAKKGAHSVRLNGCGHVFCRECLHDYLSLHLTEGSLRLALSCPDPSCMSSAGERTLSSTLASKDAHSEGAISVAQLEEILADSPELIRRLHFLKEKAVAEADPSSVPCPRPDCQTLTPAREEDRGDSRWQSFRECPSCSMVFCAFCRLTWHAPNPCVLSSSNAILSKYEAASDHEKRAMELRYGRKNLLKLKAQFEEDKANRDWLKERTTACPHCSSPVEKSMGEFSASLERLAFH